MRTFLIQHNQNHDLRMEDIRQAALSSNYPNREALNTWLDHPEVMGENRRLLNRAQASYLRAVRLCPLEPRPYLEIAKLAWLSLAPEEMEERLMQQALTARPFEGFVRMEYGHWLQNAGQTAEAIASYQIAFQQDVRCREPIITVLSPQYPPSFFLDSFQMDRLTLMKLHKAYAGTSDAKGYRNLVQLLAKAELAAASIASGEISANHLVAAHQCFAELGEVELATSTLQKSIKRHKNSYSLRWNLGHWLYERGQYSEALPHLEWCHHRRPDIKSITQQIELAHSKSDWPLQLAEDLNDNQKKFR